MMKRLFHKFDTIKKKVIFEYNNKKHFFSHPAAFYYSLCPYLKKYGSARHKAILNYLTKDESSVIEKWRNVASDQRNKGKHPVHLLDSSNYKEYITLPDGLEEKLVRNNNLACLADVIRFNLLSRYGGIWLDATIYVSQPIEGWNTSLYSIRHAKGSSKYVLDGWRWSAFMFACTPGSILPSFVYDAFINYFSKHDVLIDYFLVDYFIALIYLNNQEMHKEIDSLPADNTDTLELLMNLSRPYDKEWLEQCLTRRRFHKLDWRVNPSGSDTMFAHLK